MTSIVRFFRDPGGSFFLFGPRGTGKSTWLREQFDNPIWIDLLDPEEYRRYLARPERLRGRIAAEPQKRVVVVDEIQKVPALLDVVHQVVETEGAPRFVLTGSSARKLRRAGVDLLAGRAILRSLHPFMAAELGSQFDLDSALVRGLVPLVWDSDRADDVLRTYVATYVKEEVQSEGIVRHLDSFSRFLETISFSHTGVLNVTEVSRESEVNRNTVESYVHVLEDLLLAFRIPVFTKRAKRKMSTHPKFFWFDTGVFRSIRPRGPLDTPEEIGGAALEGLVAQHLRAWADYSNGQFELSFWRTKSGSEVDFVIYGAGGFCAIEVKHRATLRRADLRSLRSFVEDYPEATGRLLYRGSERILIDDILCLPVDEFLRELVPNRPLP
ncbi:MAG: ATP-binding protein [Acidobacteriota bacterium]|nr:MAG: ATP-binding protein [Acidobacteriota bacterium]